MTQNPGDDSGLQQPSSNSQSAPQANMPSRQPGEMGAPPTQNGINGVHAHLNDSFVGQQQPINDAVHHAFDDAHVSGIDQDVLISRITQQVLKQLQTAPNVFGGPPNYQSQQPPVAPLSPTASSVTSPPSVPPRDVYTPPSPRKTTDFTTDTSDSRQSSPDHHFSAPSSPKTRDAKATSVSNDTARPVPISRPSLSEETTLEKIWGKLFDAEGNPTKKLGQLLRGTATHMIECYEPKHSLVVTPHKMQKFYKDHPIAHEPYPWDAIFDDDESCISRMYRQLGCEHHLIQEPDLLYEKPDIPGLTPAGFQHWATMLIFAHPDEALQRFQNVVQGLPINNPDDSTRFPKELPRKLFPKEPSVRIRDQLVAAIEAHARVHIDHPDPSDTPRGQAPNTMSARGPSPPRSEASVASDAPSMGSHIERERKPYSANMPSSCAIDDTNAPLDAGASKPIERERKPYAAAPGGGRTFDEEDRSSFRPPQTSVPPPPKSASHVPPPPSIHRANSTASSSRPISIPPPPSDRGRDYPPSAYSPNPSVHRASVSRRRNYSPPPAPGFRSSEGDLSASSMASSYENRRMPTFVEPGHDDGGRYYPREMRDSDSRRADYARGPSPGKRFERSGTNAHEGDSRRPNSYMGEDFYPRPRRETTGSRPAW